MNRAIPVLLALVLVLSLPVMTAGGSVSTGFGSESERATGASNAALQQAQTSQSTPVEAENTTNRLPLPADASGGYVEHNANLGATLASADDELRITHEQYVIADSEFADASSDERAEMIEAAYDRIQERVDAIEERERNAIQDYANGERSDAEVLGAIARNYHEADVLDDAIADLEIKSHRTSGYSLSSSPIRADRSVLDFYRTTIRADIAAAAEDPGTEPYSFLLETSQDGYRLSTLDGGAYLTETIRFDNRDPSLSDQFEGFESLEHTNELYPWAAESIGNPYPNSQGHSSERGFYWIEYLHNHGTLEVHLDAGTGDIYHEVQDLSVSSLPIATERTSSGDGIDVTLSETAASGPVEVAVSESTFSDPDEATVWIDGTPVGETDPEDGTLWVLPPSGEYELTVEASNGTLNETVSPEDAG